ncbi:MAG: CDP-alcohol phosphatidyltransferase family protein [Phycisphaerae bacterium]|jgi:CDP-diacylglycerol--glycerol-3-phosphate 3-phosphatidyltransferase
MVKQIPNMLTFGRLILSVVFLVMVYLSPGRSEQNWPNWLYLDVAFALFVVAGLTDLADGYLARKFDATSKFGRIVDPLADKVLICGAFIVFAVIGEPKLFNLDTQALAIIQWTFVGVIIAREATVTIIRQWSESRGIVFPATWSGKLKMFLQAFAVGTVMVKMAHVQTDAWGYWFTSVVYIATISITIISGVLSFKKLKT